RQLTAYLFISPFFILFLVFMAFPLVFSFYLSFHKWDGFSQPDFVGLRNYLNLFSDSTFYETLYNTVYMFLIATPLQLIGALVLAGLLNAPSTRLRSFFRAAFYMPYITCVVVISVMFLILYDYRYGFINYFLSWIGLGGIPWIDSAAWSKISIVLLIFWRWTGYNMVILLAGMQAIDNQLYEAARIDGAGTLQLFFRLTIPLLKPVLFFCYILMVIGQFQLFAEPFVLTKGGPEYSSLTIVHYLYKQGFEFFRLGYASAIAYTLLAITFILSYINSRILENP
ncbi:MAG: sugar ABC transporter permease, partial [Planctomycetes bacterium]|nr:sugar ABC transporter permease [Planctomycetota bacterium]